MISQIKKRDGKISPFDSNKISQALRKAMIAVNGEAPQNDIAHLTHEVLQLIQQKYGHNGVPSVEHIQDIVETVLLKAGYVNIARAYIAYRAKHNEVRKEVALQSAKQTKADHASYTNILSTLTRLSQGLTHVHLPSLAEAVAAETWQEISYAELFEVMTQVVSRHIELHYDYSYLAARVVLDTLYQSVLGVGYGDEQLHQKYQEYFITAIQTGVSENTLDSRLLQFGSKQFSALSAQLKPERDELFLYLGLQTLKDRYLLRKRDAVRTIFELPQYFWMRVAMGMCIQEDDQNGGREYYATAFYEELSTMRVVSSTPTLFNSGTTHPQMSSCYLNTVDDSMEGIFGNFADDAQLSKWAGGIGTNWTNVRAKGSRIRGTNGASQGVVPFLKIYNDIALAVNQGGKRKGAMCAYLELWHSDVEEFIELRKNTGDERRRTHDIHTALFIPDLFMKRVKENGSWTLFSPDTVPELTRAYGQEFEQAYIEYEQQAVPGKKTMQAAQIWKKILTLLYETGHPWITFKDAMNIRSPQDHVGMIHNSNLCTEITLNTSKEETAVCNLASINLSKFVSKSGVDEQTLRQSVHTAMRMLDNVIDHNYYPIDSAKNSNVKHRPVGLGVMGYQDALYTLKIEYCSEENLDFADWSQELISHCAIEASALLAKERGRYSSYEGSKWARGLLPLDTLDLLQAQRGYKIPVPRTSYFDWEPVRALIAQYGMRNANCMAIAPTATISNIAGCVPCVEPSFKNIYIKENLSGNFVVLNKHLVDDLEALQLWNPKILSEIKLHNGSVQQVAQIPETIKNLYKETFEMDAHWILEAAARRSKWIDQSASTNIFMKGANGKQLSDVYQRAWELGLKTTYYLRTQAASQVTKTTLQDATEQEKHGQVESLEQQFELAELPKELELVSITNGEAPKMCLLADPDCEACQ
jgi:ribonucleoside-diphosphate reductase alpha chain